MGEVAWTIRLLHATYSLPLLRIICIKYTLVYIHTRIQFKSTCSHLRITLRLFLFIRQTDTCKIFKAIITETNKPKYSVQNLLIVPIITKTEECENMYTKYVRFLHQIINNYGDVDAFYDHSEYFLFILRIKYHFPCKQPREHDHCYKK